MASAASDTKVERPYIGRPSNNVKMGIVGMPNVGKSTMFNLLSKLDVPAMNYPFCTIDPTVAKVPVPDARYDFLVNFHKPKSEVPAFLTITDIAGLVKGAHEGKGLGNAFLSHITAVDGIYHLVRAFKDPEIEHVEGDVDPVRDLDIISRELLLKDKAWVDDVVANLQKQIDRGQAKERKQELETLKKVQAYVSNEVDVRMGEWDAKDLEVLESQPLLTAKPVIYLVNISEQNFLEQKNKWLVPIKNWVKQRTPGAPVIPFSATFEQKLQALTADEKKNFLEEKKSQSMLNRIITTGYHELGLVHFFTCGADEVRCWTIRKGTKAPQAAGVIHSDFERGFICAEVMSYEDFVAAGSEAACKAAGKYKAQGKAYVMVDGDIVFFKFNVTDTGKKKK